MLRHDQMPGRGVRPECRGYQSPPGYFMFGSAVAERRTDAMNTRCSTRRQLVSRRIPGKQAWAFLLLFAFFFLLFAVCNLPGCFGATKPDIVVAIIWVVVVADGALNILRLIVPRPTPQHAR